MRAAFQGEVGAFSEEAVRALFAEAEAVPMVSFEDVFEAVAGGAVERAVIPIENSLFGSVHINYDLLHAHRVQIVGEVWLRIRHHLMALAGTTLATVRQVHSHPQALGQCRTFLREQLPQAEVVPAYDTAGAARMVAAMGVRDAAAIAGARAAAEYGLDVLAAGIESNHQNYTRFLVLAPGKPSTAASRPDGKPKTSIVFALRDTVPGALFKSLAVFFLRDLDLFKIESRPLIGRPGSYLFYLDVEGALEDEAVRRALDHLAEVAADVRVLGSYAQGAVLEDG